MFNAYFTDYQSPSSMYKKLSETKGAVNEFRVDSIKEVLSKLQRMIDYTPKDDVLKIGENEKIIDVVERILNFNQLNHAGKGLKLLAKCSGNNSEKLKYEIRQLLYSLYR